MVDYTRYTRHRDWAPTRKVDPAYGESFMRTRVRDFAPIAPAAAWNGRTWPGKGAFVLGQRHPAVRVLDERLWAHGYRGVYDAAGESVGDLFNATTRAAVSAFQRDQGWTGADADGYPGQITWDRLMAAGLDPTNFEADIDQKTFNKFFLGALTDSSVAERIAALIKTNVFYTDVARGTDTKPLGDVLSQLLTASRAAHDTVVDAVEAVLAARPGITEADRHAIADAVADRVTVEVADSTAEQVASRLDIVARPKQ